MPPPTVFWIMPDNYWPTLTGNLRVTTLMLRSKPIQTPIILSIGLILTMINLDGELISVNCQKIMKTMILSVMILLLHISMEVMKCFQNCIQSIMDLLKSTASIIIKRNIKQRYLEMRLTKDLSTLWRKHNLILKLMPLPSKFQMIRSLKHIPSRILMVSISPWQFETKNLVDLATQQVSFK